jgi:hypothetical protein
MKSSEITLYVTGFLIIIFLLILIVKLIESKFNPSIYEILTLILLFSIAVGIHGVLHFCEEITNNKLLNILKLLSGK